jgi:WD40 repeat protein
VAVGDDYGRLSLVDVGKEAVVWTTELKERPFLRAVVFAPDGASIAVGGGDPNSAAAIWLYAAATGKALARLAGHGSWIMCVAYSPDGKLLASTSEGRDASTRLWDVTARKEIRRWNEGSRAVAFSPDGKVLAGGDSQGDILFWDARSGERLRRIPRAGVPVETLAFSPDSKLIASTHRSGTVRLWNVRTGAEVLVGPGHQSAVVSVAFSPDGKRLATRGADARVYIWDVSQGRPVHRLKTGPSFVYGSEHNSPARVHSVLFSPDGRSIVAAGTDPRDRPPAVAYLWDAGSGKLRHALKAPYRYCVAVDFSPDGTTLAICPSGHDIELWSAAGGRRGAVLRHAAGQGGSPAGYAGVAFSLDAVTLAAPGGDARGQAVVRFWDLAGAKWVREIRAQQPAFCCIAYSPNGKTVACADTVMQGRGHDSTVSVWEVATGQLIRKFRGHRGRVSCVAFSPDGRMLASSGQDDKTVRLWSVLTGEQLAVLAGHLGAVYGVAFSPDGRLLASGSADTTALLWDVQRIGSRPPATHPCPAGLARLWAELRADDASKAYAALAALAGAGDEAVEFLNTQLRPAAAPGPGAVADLVAGLDAKRFAAREAATRGLAKLGDLAEPAMRKALADNPSAEAARRLRKLLAALQPYPTDQDGIRDLRALQVLELIGSPAALAALDKLAQGAPGSPLTRDARSALSRLKHPRSRP